MNRRSFQFALYVAGCGILAVVLLLSMDAFIATGSMNPVPAAEAAAASAGWQADLLQLRSFDASGGLFGSSAMVEYRLANIERGELLEVHLRRPFLTRQWQIVTLRRR